MRFEDELGFRMDERTEALLRASSELVTAAGRRARSRRAASGCPPTAFAASTRSGCSRRSADELDGRLDALDDPDFRLVVVFGSEPLATSDLERAQALLGRASTCASGRTIPLRGRSIASGALTEPWALDALAFVGAPELVGVVEAARRADPTAPLVRGDELGIEPGPAIGRILDVIDEERAAGTISTREEALALARELAAVEAST